MGRRLFEEAIKAGFEGIMAKEKDSPYLPGVRSRHWLKIKKTFDIDAVVTGFIKGKKGRPFSSLILGLFAGDMLIHIGQVGTSFDAAAAELILKRLNALKIKISPFDGPLKGIKGDIRCCKPLMVVRVPYQEITRDWKLRAPVFKNIRDDKSPDECIIPPYHL